MASRIDVHGLQDAKEQLYRLHQIAVWSEQEDGQVQFSAGLQRLLAREVGSCIMHDNGALPPIGIFCIEGLRELPEEELHHHAGGVGLEQRHIDGAVVVYGSHDRYPGPDL